MIEPNYYFFHFPPLVQHHNVFKKIPPSFIFHLMRSQAFVVTSQAFAKGSTSLHICWKKFVKAKASYWWLIQLITNQKVINGLAQFLIMIVISIYQVTKILNVSGLYLCNICSVLFKDSNTLYSQFQFLFVIDLHQKQQSHEQGTQHPKIT